MSHDFPQPNFIEEMIMEMHRRNAQDIKPVFIQANHLKDVKYHVNVLDSKEKDIRVMGMFPTGLKNDYTPSFFGKIAYFIRNWWNERELGSKQK